MKKRRFALVSALAAAAGVFLVAGGGAPASDSTNLRAATVHPKLLDQLEANPTGGVTAVVTAWGRDGLDDITRLGVTGTKLKVLPMVITQSLTLAQLEKLQASPAVRSVWHNEKFDLYMEDSTWITRARYVWPSSNGSDGPHGFGVTGQGVELAMIDTGFDGKHEDGDNLIEFCETIQAATSSRASVICSPWDPDFNAAPAGPCGATDPIPSGIPRPCDNLAAGSARGDSRDEDVSHGTHVGGTMVGTGHASGGQAFTHSTIGMAPQAKLRAYSANVASSLLITEILASYDDMTFKKEEGYSRVVAVNNSWGGGTGGDYNPDDPTHMAIERAWAAGILSVFAAGNAGPEHNTLGHQCVSPFVACVAATTKPDSVVMFSSRGRPSQVADTDRDGTAGDTGDVPPDNHDWRLGQALGLGRYRPTLAAPGTAINSMKAIGLNIGDPTSAACREDPDQIEAGCYVQAMGTSMATPHVTGAIGLIVQAYRQGHNGRTPTPNQIIDILERSANKTKLPGWEAEEQGAGRLDAYEAVRLARTYSPGPRPNLGYPTPPYVLNAYPGGPMSTLATEDKKGCTAPGSWSTKSIDFGLIEQPPLPVPPLPSGGTYAQHFIDVPAKVDRLRITVTWPKHDLTTNLYARLWRPGVAPDTDTQTPDYRGPTGLGPVARTPAYHQTRVFPDQEATGIPVGLPPRSRLVDVRAPEESNSAEGSPGIPSTLPQGQWILRVYHRAGGTPTACQTPTDEQPPQPVRLGYEYDLKVEVGKVTHRPSVRIDSPAANTNTTGRYVTIRGRAAYPPPDAPVLGPNGSGNVGHPWEGVTNWEVPESAGGDGEGGEEPPPGQDTRTVLYFHGNRHNAGEPGEANTACQGKGETDVFIVGCGPFLLPNPNLSLLAPANFGPSSPVINGVADRSPYDPNWVWCLAAGPGCPEPPLGSATRPGPTTVQGPMTVEWWASTAPAASDTGFTMGWTIRLWADGRLAFESGRIEATPSLPGLPSRLKAVVSLPRIRAEQRFVLHVDPNAVDIDQEANFVYYDSQGAAASACADRGETGPPAEPPAAPTCDSLVKVPVVPEGAGNGGGATGVPQNVRVTDLPVNAPNPDYPNAAPSLAPRLRVAWDPVQGASYRVHRSTNPAFIPSSSNRVYPSSGGSSSSGPGQECPQGESPNTPTDNNPPGEERSGVCFTDMNVSLLQTYYYRVVAVKDGIASDASGIAYGTPTRYDRQVKLKVDRLYGPQYWEYALLPPSPTPYDTTNTGIQWTFLWDTLELIAGPHNVGARSFTQGIGSTKQIRPLNDDGGNGGQPPPNGGCPDDDDGDGDDDEDDGDSDDDGDDGDDDCEDDDDDEEEDDD